MGSDGASTLQYRIDEGTAIMEISIIHLATLFTIVLGPLKVIGPFAVTTRNADPALKRQIASRAFVLSTIISLVIAALGGFLMSRLNMSTGTLAIVMGFFLGHWSLQTALAKNAQAAPPELPTIDVAIFPISLPVIIPPQGVALLVLATDLELEAHAGYGLLLVMALIVVVMFLNWLFMLAAPWLMKFPVFWIIVGRIVAVIVSALALQIIIFGLRNLGIVA
jgi:multiple antibiotic resistance protein